MKKFVWIFAIILLAGCGNQKEEKILLKCQKLRNYEFYNGANVIGIHGYDSTATKIEMVENYTPKWDDVDNEALKKQLETHKSELAKTYKNMEYKIEEYRRDITSDILIPIDKENMTNLKEDDNYKEAIKKDIFQISLYRSLLENNGYTCQ